VLERIHDVQAGLESIHEWASDAGADVATTALLLEPYREMLDTLHEGDLPCAARADALDQ